MAHQFDDLYSGSWLCWHWFPSKDDSKTLVNTNRMNAHQMGHELILESIPDDSESYMLIRLTIDENLATGVWHETVTREGESKGRMYSGAGQLIISDDRNRIEGEWAGLGFDHKKQKQHIYTGHWELARVAGDQMPEPKYSVSG
jgi:hypothetical protein